MAICEAEQISIRKLLMAQLQLLHEQSQKDHITPDELATLSDAMVRIASVMDSI